MLAGTGSSVNAVGARRSAHRARSFGPSEGEPLASAEVLKKVIVALLACLTVFLSKRALHEPQAPLPGGHGTPSAITTHPDAVSTAPPELRTATVF